MSCTTNSESACAVLHWMNGNHPLLNASGWSLGILLQVDTRPYCSNYCHKKDPCQSTPATVVNDTIDVDADVEPNGAPWAHTAVDSTVQSIAPATPTSPVADADSTTVTCGKMPRDHPDALGKG